MMFYNLGGYSTIWDVSKREGVWERFDSWWWYCRVPSQVWLINVCVYVIVEESWSGGGEGNDVESRAGRPVGSCGCVARRYWGSTACSACNHQHKLTGLIYEICLLQLVSEGGTGVKLIIIIYVSGSRCSQLSTDASFSDYVWASQSC